MAYENRPKTQGVGTRNKKNATVDKFYEGSNQDNSQESTIFCMSVTQ